jgi:hypothetical protein
LKKALIESRKNNNLIKICLAIFVSVCLICAGVFLYSEYQTNNIILPPSETADVSNDTEPDLVESVKENYADPELARAVAFGFGDYKTDNPTVTFAEFMTMLDKMVGLAANELKLAEWKWNFMEARKATNEMTRIQGIILLTSAAIVLGGEYAEFNTPHTYYNDMFNSMEKQILAEVRRGHSDFSLIPHNYFGQETDRGFTKEHYINPSFNDGDIAIRYGYARKSLYSHKTIMDYDEERNSMRYDEPFSYTEALLAVLRLYESKPD